MKTVLSTSGEPASAGSRTADVPFQLRTSRPAVAEQPVCGGLCVPRGHLGTFRSVEILAAGRRLPAQAEVLSRWSDKSVRWVLVSWIAPPELGCEDGVVRFHGDVSGTRPDLSAPQMVIRQSESGLIIRQAEMNGGTSPHSEIGIAFQLRDARTGKLDWKQEEWTEETSGPIRSVHRFSGRFRQAPWLSFQVRLEAWPTAGLLCVETRLRNERRARHRGGLWDLGDPGSFRFANLELTAVLRSDFGKRILWKVQPDADVRQQPSNAPFRIVQYGSGGPAWDSRNHVGADGRSTVLHRGYQVLWESGSEQGLRASPVAALEGNHGGLMVAVPEFWEKFPSSVAAGENAITIGVFPESAAAADYELQGGEQTTGRVWLSSTRPSADLQRLDWVYHPAVLLQPAVWVQNAQVLDWFAGDLKAVRDPQITVRYETWIQEVTSGPRSIAARRDAVDEYGWRNFGDVHADHEQTHYQGSGTIISHYNNQFDLIYGGIVNQFVSGDPAWRQLYDPLARHVMDIDIYHTQDDRAAFNGGLFWHTDHYLDAGTATHRTYSRVNAAGRVYGGGPGNEHNYTTGLLTYYYLTGNPEAAASVRSLADWVLAMDDGSRTVFALLDDGPTGAASATVTDDYHGPGRGSGNSINALLDAWDLTREQKYLDGAEQLIQRVVHPHQDLSALDLLNAEYRWSYTVCLTALGRYLKKMDEADRRGPLYDYVRRTLQHYGRWMLEHERPTLRHPEGLEFVTEAWAAQEFRKANVLRIAASCCDDENLAVRMRARADELNDAAWTDLYGFGDRHLTARCFSIVMTEGLRDVFHRCHRYDRARPAEEPFCGTEWTMFVPQKTRVKRMLKSPRRLPAVLLRLLQVSRWRRAMDALKRRL